MKTKSNMLVVGVLLIIVGVAALFGGKIFMGNGNEASAGKTNISSGEDMVGGNRSGNNSKAVENVGAGGSMESSGTSTSTSEGGAFVASKSGKKYFPVTCGSSKTIKKENAVYFNTSAEAESAGYTQSVQCKY